MRVLVVEDDTNLASTLKRGLEAESFSVDIAVDGTDGLWMATSVSYDLVILDIMLPGMNGQRVCRELRSAGISVPVLMLTAKDGEHDEAESLDIGADDFLSKPFSYFVLLARIRALLRRGGAIPGDGTLRCGSVALDPVSHECTCATGVVSLTRKESAILEYLLRKVDQVVTKEELVEHAWDFAFEGGTNVVEVHVSSLRRKIGAETIETVRGAGYRISDSKQPADE